MRVTLLTLLLILLRPVSLFAEFLPPIADVHVHYKWSQTEVTSPAQAVAAMQRNDVKLAVVFGTPPELVLNVKGNAQLRIVHFYQPYLQPFLKANWFLNKKVPAAVEAALASGQYQGVGEIHVTDGVGPRLDSLVFNDVLAIAARFDVPVSLHTNASSHEYMRRICQKHPQTRFLWAHAGGLGPAEVNKLLGKCSNVWVEFSARDPYKSIGPKVADDNGHLRNSWHKVIKAYPSRFMIGSDPIWPISEIDSWHTVDTGWQTVDNIYAYHRKWINDLPAELADKLRYKNAMELLK